MEEKIYYKSKKFKLCGLLNKQNNSDEIVVLCHGFLGNKNESGLFDLYVDSFNKNKINSFRFDFTSHGESEGKDIDINITNEISDLEITLDMLKVKGFNKFILVGSSMGCTIVSLINHSKYDLRGLILLYGALMFDKIPLANFSKDELNEAKNNGYISREILCSNIKIPYQLFKDVTNYKPYVNLQKLDMPILFIHGKKDRVVPYQISEDVNKMCKNSNLILIENDGHVFRKNKDSRQVVIDKSLEFIKNNM